MKLKTGVTIMILLVLLSAGCLEEETQTHVEEQEQIDPNDANLLYDYNTFIKLFAEDVKEMNHQIEICKPGKCNLYLSDSIYFTQEYGTFFSGWIDKNEADLERLGIDTVAKQREIDGVMDFCAEWQAYCEETFYN